jgi:fibronectin-binding autotransporter adhesin
MRRRTTFLLAAAICIPRLAAAQTTDWTNAAGDGSWSNAANWDNGVPGAGFTANVTNSLGVTQTVTYDYAGPAVSLAAVNVNVTGASSNSVSEILSISANTLASEQESVGGFSGSTLGGVGVGTINQAGGLNAMGAGSLVLGYNAGDQGFYNLSAGAVSDGDNEYIGMSGAGVFNQSGGSNVDTNEFPNFLGYSAGSTGNYNLSNGSVSAAGFVVGDSGAGIFNQSGGTVTCGNFPLSLANEPGGTGTYILSGGSLTCGGWEMIGEAGPGVFNQTGGSNVSGGTVNLAPNTGGTGSYSLTGGTASFAGLRIGPGGAGIFSVGGTAELNVSGAIFVADNSGTTLSFSGGTINAGSLVLDAANSAKFNWTAGTLNLVSSLFLENSGPLGSSLTLSPTQTLGITGATSTLTVQSTGTLNLNGGTINANAVSFAAGSFNWSSGTLNVSSNLTVSPNLPNNATVGANHSLGVIGASNSLIIPAGQTLTINGGVVNSANLTNSGTFQLTSGTLNLTSETPIVDKGSAADFPNAGGTIDDFNVGTGQTLDDSGEYIGYNTSGFFNTTGGSNVVGTAGLFVGYNAGSFGEYTISGGSLTSNGNQYVGYSGKGNVLAFGGTNTITGTNSLYLGYNTTGTGFYSLSRTPLVVGGTEYVGYSGTGAFEQFATGNSAGGLVLAYGAGSIGTYSFLGGTLTVSGDEIIGNGGAALFNQTGGANSSTGNLDMAGFMGSASTYLLSGGTLTVGGNASVGFESFAAGGGTATLSVSNTGQLTVQGTLGISPGSQVNVNGGTSTAGELLIFNGGVLNVNSSFFVDYGVTTKSPTATIASYLQTGFDGGAWNGTGISSASVAAANLNQTQLLYSLGYADGSDGLTSVPSGEIEIMPTLAGDAKLQGTVDFGDFQLLAQYFGQSGTWDEGNFQYGAMIGFGDFQDLARDFGQNVSGLTAGGSATLTGAELASLNQFAGQFGDELKASPGGVGFRLVSAPEPTAAALTAVGAGALVVRRRRKSGVRCFQAEPPTSTAQ